MHSGFADIDGKIYTCGSNEYGELGINNSDKLMTPTLVNFNERVTQI